MTVSVRMLPGLVVRRVIAAPPEVAVVTLGGDIDLRNCEDLALILAQIADDRAVRSVVVDLLAVPFLAACGVRCLARVREEIECDGRRISLVVRAGPGAVRRVLDLVGGFDVVECVPVGR
ncbi:STAS domain-containing protein [Pseudonocardia yuanmonensis]